MPQNQKQTEHVELKDGQAYCPLFLCEKIQKKEKFEMIENAFQHVIETLIREDAK